MTEQTTGSVLDLNVKQGRELLKKAKALIKYRRYKVEEVSQNPSTIDIETLPPDSDETVMMRIITKTDYKNNGVGVDTVEATGQLLAKPDIDKVIVFGNRFTASAQSTLQEEGIEFFSPNQNILSALDQHELYNSILRYVNELCRVTCGSAPQSRSDCTGFKKQIIPCPECNGRGKLERTASKYPPYCTACGGSGEKESKYTCAIRLISDNADFHYRKNWRRLLHKDLLDLVDLAGSTHSARNVS
jgi:hypothetical protein